MATNKNTLSVYADEKLLAALNSFKDSGNHKSLNVAIVSILEEKLFGNASDNAQSTLQSTVSSTLDIEGIVNEAIAISKKPLMLSQNQNLIAIQRLQQAS